MWTYLSLRTSTGAYSANRTELSALRPYAAATELCGRCFLIHLRRVSQDTRSGDSHSAVSVVSRTYAPVAVLNVTTGGCVSLLLVLIRKRLNSVLRVARIKCVPKCLKFSVLKFSMLVGPIADALARFCICSGICIGWAGYVQCWDNLLVLGKFD